MTQDEMRRALWGVVANRAAKAQRIRLRGRAARSLWWYVHRVTGLGSTMAKRLCLDLGFDPDSGEQVTGWHDLAGSKTVGTVPPTPADSSGDSR